MADSKIRIPGLTEEDKQRPKKIEQPTNPEFKRVIEKLSERISGDGSDEELIKRWTSPYYPFRRNDPGPDFSHLFEARKLAQKKEKKADKNKPATRESEMHRFIERIFHALCRELGHEPTSKQVFRAIEERHEEFDVDDIIQEVRAGNILWISSHGNEQRMKLSTLQNIVSKIRTRKK